MSVQNDLIKGKVEDRVRLLLLEYPELRDNDKLLWLAYNKRYTGLFQWTSAEQYRHFKEILLRDSTPMFESLSRTRRKLQENEPNIRGKTYKQRQEAAGVISDWATGRL